MMIMNVSNADGTRGGRVLPALVVLGFVLLAGLAALGLPNFKVDASADTLLVKDNALYLETREVSQRFSPEEFVLVVYRPHGSSIFSERSQADLAALQQAFSEFERVTQVLSILDVPLIESASQLSPDIDPATLTQQQQHLPPERLAQLFRDHPIFSDQLVNGDQSATALQVVFRADAEQRERGARMLVLERRAADAGLNGSQAAELETLRNDYAAREELLQQQRRDEIVRMYQLSNPYRDHADILLGGNYVLVYHLLDIITSDLSLFGLVIAGFITVLLALLFRHPLWVIVPLLCCALSLVATMGLFGHLGIRITVISANFIALQLILTLAIVVHLIVQYQGLRVREPALSHTQLVWRTLQAKLAPCLFAGLTTAVGFASLLLSGIQPVISFGWMMIVAMATSLLVSLALFPALLLLRRHTLPFGRNRPLDWCLAGAERVSRHRPGLVLGLSALLVVGSLWGMTRLTVENSFLDYFRDDTQVHRELVYIDQQFGGTTPLDIVIQAAPARDPELVVSAAEVQLLQRLQATLEGSPAAGKVMSVANFAALARDINGGKPLTEYELSSLYRLIDTQLRDKLLGSYLDPDSGALRLSVRIKDATEGLNRQRFLASVHQVLNELGLAQEQVSVSNLFVLYQDILQRLYQSQILTMGLVYLALGMILVLIFKSLRVGVVALIPNVVATLFILGVMGWLNIPLDLMTITIVAIAMGIAVDDTIHFTHHYLQRQRQGLTPLHDSFRQVGSAMLITSLIIAAGFSVLGVSDFVPSIYFGLLTAAAMLIALVTDLTLLPVMLERWVKRRGSYRAAVP